jgi:hypothetical protein
MTEHVSQMTIDGLAARLLSDAETATARAHVASCTRCRGDLETAEAACATFTREVLPRTLDRLAPRRAAPWRILAPAFAVSGLATVLLVVWFVRRAPVPPTADDDLRMKGALTFQVFASRGDQVFAVRDATRLAAGDKIRFVVGAGEARYVLVASIDGAGHATIYHPYGGARSAPAPVQPTDLPGSIVLDAAPGPERVFALVSREPLAAGDVARTLEALGERGAAAIRATPTLDLPGVTQASVVFEKAAP